MHNKTEILGWREWVGLPQLGIPLIKAKVDTGARTSALHTFAIETFTKDGRDWLKFFLHPIQMRDDIVVSAEAPIMDQRWVTDSGGHQEYRYVIASSLHIMQREFPIEITLTTRDTMRFRMLLGRTALCDKYIVDPAQSYAAGEHAKSSVVKMYRKSNLKPLA